MNRPNPHEAGRTGIIVRIYEAIDIIQAPHINLHTYLFTHIIKMRTYQDIQISDFLKSINAARVKK